VLSLVLCATGADAAQRLDDCRSAQPTSVGVSIGRSSPYLEVDSSAVGAPRVGSVSVESGGQLAGRLDLPVAGPLRLRVEAATARWDVRHRLYLSASGETIADRSLDRISTRHLVALVGLRTGRAPMCAHVSIGGGLYSFGLPGAIVRRPGFAFGVGMEIPTGEHGAVQLDVGLHLVTTRDAYPITSSAIPAASLSIGWAYRF